MSDKLGMKLVRYWIIPMNLRGSSLFCSGGSCVTALTLSSSTLSPLVLSVCLMYLISFVLIKHMFLLSFKLYSLAPSNNFFRLWSHFSMESPKTSKSSTIFITPSRPSVICAIVLGNTSGTNEIPNGKCRNLYPPV